MFEFVLYYLSDLVVFLVGIQLQFSCCLTLNKVSEADSVTTGACGEVVPRDGSLLTPVNPHLYASGKHKTVLLHTAECRISAGER